MWLCYSFWDWNEANLQQWWKWPGRKYLHHQTCLFWKENSLMLLLYLVQFLILILEGVRLVSCYFSSITWPRSWFLYRKITCAFLHPERCILQGLQKIWAVPPASYCGRAESPSSPPSLTSPRSRLQSLDKVQDLCKAASRGRAGLELMAGSLENRRHPQLVWPPLSPMRLRSQRSVLLPQDLPRLGTGKLEPHQKAFHLFPLVCVL